MDPGIAALLRAASPRDRRPRPLRQGIALMPAPSLTREAGARILAALSAFADHHRTTPGAAADLLAGAKNLPNQIAAGLIGSEGARSFTTATYDRVLGALSFAWPAGLPWPDDVPRPRPIPLDPERAGPAEARFGPFDAARQEIG